MPTSKEREQNVPFVPRSKVDELATEVAKALDDESRLPLYRFYCRRHSEQDIRRALAAARAVPSGKIRKSRPALFFYLLKLYAQQDK